MPEEPPAAAHSIRVSPEAAAAWPEGVAPPVRWVDPGRVPVGDIATGVQNWDYYDGALVGIGVSDGTTFTISGSGVMVAPGLVLTTTHVLQEHLDALESKTLSLWCVGPRLSGRADLWALRTLRYPETESDIAFLGVDPYSEIPDDWELTCLPLSTRAPQKDETLTVVGFRFDDAGAIDDLPPVDGIQIVSRGQLYAAAGRTAAVYYQYRDQVMAPFPIIEVACGSLGGMSGGAVLDRNGAVVGILSTGLSHDDGRGPSNAAWIIHALMFTVTLLWPRALYSPDTPLLDLPDDLLRIVGREHVRLTGTHELEYTPWH
jgi:hypothetical protein